MSQFDSNHWTPIYTEETDYRQSCGEDLLKRLAWNCNFYEPRMATLRATEDSQNTQLNGQTSRGANAKINSLGATSRGDRMTLLYMRNTAIENAIVIDVIIGEFPNQRVFKSLSRDGNPTGMNMSYNGRPFVIRDQELSGAVNIMYGGTVQPV